MVMSHAYVIRTNAADSVCNMYNVCITRLHTPCTIHFRVRLSARLAEPQDAEGSSAVQPFLSDALSAAVAEA